MELANALTAFREAADAKADFAEPASEDLRLFDAMAMAWQIVSAHGPDGLQAFKAMLHDDSRHVRGWVAAQLLAMGDETALLVLESEVELGGMRGFAAEVTIEEWRKGKLGPPFPVAE